MSFRDHPAEFYAWLQWAMAKPYPRIGVGDRAHPGSLVSSCPLGESKAMQPVPDVEILAGRAAHHG